MPCGRVVSSMKPRRCTGRPSTSGTHVGNLGALANQLECMAFIAIARDRPIRAARLLGAAEALRESAEAPMPMNERAEYGPALERLHAIADAEAIASAWATGRLMPTDDMVTFAREEA